MEHSSSNKFVNNTVSVIGVSVKEGQKLTGVEQSPEMFRNCGLLNAIKELGWEINDRGNLTKEDFAAEIKAEEENGKKYKHELENIEVIGCVNKKLAELTETSSREKEFVLTLGGDHGIASGSIDGV